MTHYVTSDRDVQEKSIIMRGSVILLAAAAHNLNFTALAISGLCMYTANWVLVLHFPVSMYVSYAQLGLLCQNTITWCL